MVVILSLMLYIKVGCHPPPTTTHHPQVSMRGQISQLGGGKGRCVGSLWVTLGSPQGHCRSPQGNYRSPQLTIGHHRATMGLLRLTIGYLKAIHIRVTLGHLKVTIGSFFSELHPKVRPTCFSQILIIILILDDYTFSFHKCNSNIDHHRQLQLMQ